MSAGPRGLLAFWMGGAAAPPSSPAGAGLRSQLAPWIGGASAPAAGAPTAGTRGLLAPWIGGASAPAGTATAGYRGLLGFWAGGLSAGPAAPEPEPQAFALSGGPDRLDLSDDDLIEIAFALIASGALDG